VKVTRFDRSLDLLVVKARVWGPRGNTPLRFAVDTGAADTVITPELIDKLGYSPRDGERITTVRTAIGKEHGYSLRVKRFAALGFTVLDCRIHVFDLATGDDIDGLIGLSFLRKFNYHVRSEEGRILVERAAKAA
jgi:clan AA aspartic protease (TIGR02281 family)